MHSKYDAFTPLRLTHKEHAALEELEQFLDAENDIPDAPEHGAV